MFIVSVRNENYCFPENANYDFDIVQKIIKLITLKSTLYVGVYKFMYILYIIGYIFGN